MHQKAFGASPDTLAAIWGLLLRGRGGEGRGRGGREGEGKAGKRKGRKGEPSQFFCSSLHPCCLARLRAVELKNVTCL